MSTFSDAYEVTAADRTGKGVTGLPDTPGYTTLAMQQQFDSLANLSITKFNAMVNAAETSITSSDTNFPTSKAAKDYADGVGATVKAAVEAEIIQSDWNQADNTKTDYIKNKPTALSQFSEDSTHRLVSDTEKTTWNGKQNALTFDNSPTSGSNNPVKSGGIYTDEQNIYKVMGKNGAKNRLPISLATLKTLNTSGSWAGNVYTANGLDVTVNSDVAGNITSLKVTGTASTTLIFTLLTNITNADYPDSLTMSGCPSGGSGSTYCVRCRTISPSVTLASDYGSGTTVSIPNDGNSYQFIIRLQTDTVCPVGGLIFYPMLRLASDTDSTYQPYAMTNKELTEKVTKRRISASDLGSTTFTVDPASCVDIIGNVIYPHIRLTGVTATAYDTVVFTVASAYRPDYTARGCVQGGGNPVGMSVDSYGSIKVNSNLSSTSLVIDGMCWTI